MAEKLEEAPAAHAASELKVERPKRAKLSEEETLRRIESFDERKEQFVASVRQAAFEALQEEAVLVVAHKVYHSG